MLVLSRRPSEKILFPGFNTAVQVLSIKGHAVRLAIDAPPEIVVLRDELQNRSAEWGGPAMAEPPQRTLRELRHLVRNQLNVATVGLALLRKQAQAGLIGNPEQTVVTIEQQIEMLMKRLEGEAAKPASPQPKSNRLRKALLVEDDQNERTRVAGRVLRMSGFAVETAGDGCDALDHLRTGQRPDVVVS